MKKASGGVWPPDSDGLRVIGPNWKKPPMTDTEKQPESDAVAVLKADAASAGAKAAAVAARIAEAAKVAPGEVALALILARLADPELAREALALADGPRALTVAAVADTVGAPDRKSVV